MTIKVVGRGINMQCYNHKRINKTSMLKIGIMIINIVLLLFLTSKKCGMHEDEYYTYALSNNQTGMSVSFEDGKQINSQQYYEEVFNASKLDFARVWENQKNDVHPPLYYMIFHIFTRFTHNFWGLKTGIILNICFHVFNIMILYKIIEKVFDKTFFCWAGCIFYAFMPIVLGNVLLQRMYTLLATFTLLLLFIVVKRILNKKSERFYIYLFCVSVGGSLVHYYFLIYLFFVCLIGGIYLIVEKAWKEVLLFLATMICAAGACIMIFPPIVQHIFFGYRGQQSFDNFLHSSYGENIGYFVHKINYLFGGLVAPIFLIILAIIVYYIYTKQKQKVYIWMVLTIPSIGYFLIVSKISVLLHERYMVLLYGNSIILIIGMLDVLSQKLKNKRIAYAFCAFYMAGIVIYNWFTYEWKELYQEAESAYQIAQNYGRENDCIHIYTATWKSIPSIYEFALYQNNSFIKMEELNNLIQNDIYQEYDRVVVYIDREIETDQIEEMLKEIMRVCPQLHEYKELYQYNYQKVYYLD